MHATFAGRLTGRSTKWMVLVFWLVALGVGGTFGSKLMDVQNNEASSWLPASAESTRALERLTPFYDPDTIPTVVAYEKKSGLTPADIAAAKEQATEFAGLEGVEGKVVGPIPSQDGKAMQTLVNFNFGANGWMEMPDTADRLRDIASVDGGTTFITGSGGQAADASEVFGGIDGALLFSALGIVILILLVTYRSPVLWFLPISCSVVALMAAEGLIYALAKYADLTVNGQSQSILSILVIGAGTDYALLLVARYREELRRHDDRHEAMAFALHRAAPAILASASTVVAGMLCLLFAEMNSTAGLGPVTAIGVAVTYLVMVTLLPALLVICGRWVFWPKRPTFGSDEPTQAGFWRRSADRISRAPRKVWAVTTAVLLLACLGTLQLDTSGIPTAEQYTTDIESVDGQQMLADHGLADASNTLQVVANADEADQVSDALAGIAGVGKAGDPVVKDGTAFFEAPLQGDVASPTTFTSIEEARDAVHAVPGADGLVGGWSAIYLDTKIASTHDNKVIIPLILLVVLLILVALLRALTAPLILLATVVLSFGAALGLSTLLFVHVLGFEHTDPSFPLFAFVFLVALGIDYNIFLMTRVREETQVRGTRAGSIVALGSTGGVITSAGLVLAATFAVLGTIPLVFLAELGLTVALGILLDTMIVRSVLVTAINLDLGQRIWWPSRLASRDESELGSPPEQPDPAARSWEPANVG
ncbi:MMPL family transporter [Nocardioides marmoribigeumensis]|uniref:RND superfamily putative drug exporter n=1 Tax=Nocardioides marmoribigeumensis TaxID=433649 RepID=A0ABU2C0B6_9ACTN|nr:MMPL family transporter [Nocardioides marmoribigeumensis]MDR7364095.1 RND superfamily putative drug exporter [Nocardioides marmoribigeumensis]